MSLHQEIAFEDEICAHLGANGWLYEKGAANDYDRARALYAPDLLAWIQETQPKAWDALQKSNGAGAEALLLDRLRKQLDDRGTLDVLRHGIDLLGLKSTLLLAQFKPAMGMNPDITARYAANRLRLVRQLRYSLHNENCIDLVLFVNGIPVATCELKTDFTWERIWSRDSWLEILGRYLVTPRDDRKRIAEILFPLSSVRRHARTRRGDPRRRGGRSLSHPAFRRQRQDQLPRVDGPFLGGAARRERCEGLRHRAGGQRPHGARCAAAGCDLFHPDLPVRAGRGAEARSDAGQALRGHRRRGA